MQGKFCEESITITQSMFKCKYVALWAKERTFNLSIGQLYLTVFH